MFQNTGVAGPSSTPVSDVRQACDDAVLPERNVDHLVVDFILDIGGDLLLLLRRQGARIGVAHRFHLGVLRPAEPGAVLALAADLQVGDRIRDIRRRSNW